MTNKQPAKIFSNLENEGEPRRILAHKSTPEIPGLERKFEVSGNLGNKVRIVQDEGEGKKKPEIGILNDFTHFNPSIG